MPALTPLRPKKLAQDYLPGLGDEFEIGLAGVGSHVITTTASGVAMQTALHSLRTEPSIALVQPAGSAIVGGGASAFVTSFNTSAVYYMVVTASGPAAASANVPVRILVVR
jgi:hypothetical protein